MSKAEIDALSKAQIASVLPCNYRLKSPGASKRLEAEPNVVAELRRRSRSLTIGVRDRERANIIRLRVEGLCVEAVAERLRTTPKRVSILSSRFARSGLDGLAAEPGRGRKASITAAEGAPARTQ